jgi:hypothetical protein
MFLSKDDLKLAFGIDLEIAGFYVDRKVPEGNAYWKGRKLYVNTMPAYIFMPIYTDLLFRCGIPKKDLLKESFIGLAEAIMHSAAVQEFEGRPLQQHFEESLELAQKGSVNPFLLGNLSHYFLNDPKKTELELGTPFRSLNRADAYLCALCALDFSPQLAQDLIDAWYALITFYLITDDLEDIRSDLQDGSENIAIETGLSDAAASRIESMMVDAYSKMEKLNPVMANRMDHKRQTLDVKGILRSFYTKS